MTERFFYLEAEGTAFLAAFHPPAGATRDTALLFVPPFGWEEIASHRARRRWAEDVAAHGYAALRIDLPGTGDSAGGPGDPRLWASWNTAVTVAAAWLRAEAGASVVTAVGIGLGGLLAYQAAARRDVDDVVLWATHSRGRSGVRELVAFSAHETARIVEAGAPEPPPLPEGWLAPGGFLLSPETLADLRAVDLGALRLPSRARVLLLDRDGVKPDPGLTASIVESGAELTIQSGTGYSAMLTDPDQAHAPLQVFEQARAWLDGRPGGPPGSASGPGTHPAEAEATVAGVRERPFSAAGPDGRLAGIVAEPIGGATASLTAVFLNAGAIRRVGPHRLWVETARRWGRQGLASLRLDVEGIGDSDGDENLFNDVGHFHEQRFVDQARAALDELASAGVGDRFILVGLCSGAYWGFHALLADDRVAAALMINPRVLYWDEELEIARELRRTRLLTKAVTWKRVLRGDVSLARWAAMGRWLASSPVRLVRGRRGAEAGVAARIEAAFDRLEGLDRRARFVFCDGEPLFEELTRGGLLAQPDRWPSVSVVKLPGRDHTLRPLWMHEHVAAALDGVLEAELALVPAPG